MASLNNNYINQTYHGLIKTEDNGPIDGNLKPLTDGDGNLLPIEVSTDETKFAPNSTVDFTDVDVVGLSGIGAQGAQGPTGNTGAQGPTGTTGAQGVQGSTGTTGAQGATGNTGAQGPQGTAGTNGAQGAQGPTGNTGAQGATGTTGAQGVQGPQGIDGTQGATGDTGAQGVQGPQGIDGVQGAQGAQGSGVQGAQGPQGNQGVSATGQAINIINSQSAPLTGSTTERVIGFITIPAGTVQLNTVYSWMARITKGGPANQLATVKAYIGSTLPTVGNATVANTGLFGVGITINPGITGTSLQKIFMTRDTGLLNNLNTFYTNTSGAPTDYNAPTGNTAATLAIDWTVDQYIQITGQLANAVDNIFCASTSFTAMNGIGAQGAAGGAGAQGAQGPTGLQGFTGPQGNAGTNGTDGAQGAQGTAGTDGAQGAQGPTGLQGFTGPQGNQGPQGTAGTDGISAGSTFYFNQSEASDVLGYRTLSTQPTSATVQTITKNLTDNQQNVLVQEFITDELGFAVIPAGVQRFSLYYTIPTSNTNVDTYLTLQLANSAGVPYGPIITSGLAEIGYNAGNPDETNIEVVLPTTAISTTDRMICKLYLNNEDNANRSVVWSTENGYYSFVITSVGVVGNQGPQGPQGPTGLQGFTGPQGNAGTNGTDGAQGAQGPQGIDGTQGATGSGTQGPQGPTGSGAQGAQGPQGPSSGGGGGGLINGAGLDSLISAPTLTTDPALSPAASGISLGNNAVNNGTAAVVIGKSAAASIDAADGVAIGNGANSGNSSAIAFGRESLSSADNSMALGRDARATASSAIAIGYGASATTEGSIAIGIDRYATGSESVAIGRGYSFIQSAEKSTTIGWQAGFANGSGSVSIGYNSTGKGTNSIAINSRVEEGTGNLGAITIGGVSNSNANIGAYIQLGFGSSATALNAVAIGTNVVASTADTVTIKKLQMLDYATLNYADDTAAAAGGIPLGGIYHNAGALRIRIA
jgi:hypothetical protein